MSKTQHKKTGMSKLQMEQMFDSTERFTRRMGGRRPDPTPEEIIERRNKIRDSWSPEERERRVNERLKVQRYILQLVDAGNIGIDHLDIV